MAIFPVILLDNAGSDTAASGAGPTTAVTGTAAATDGVNGKTVTITDAVDLSGVAVDGSAALYLIDTTAGHRVFDQITAVSGTSGNWTVTVANGFSISLSGKSWATGGKRATLDSNSGNSLSLRLWDNNSAAGDAMPGWAAEMQSGYTASTAGVNFRRAGSTANGPIALRGKSGAATRPVLTLTGSLIPRASYLIFQAFDLKDGAAHTVDAFNLGAAGNITLIDLKFADATNYFNRACVNSNGTRWHKCHVAFCATSLIHSTGAPNVYGCDLHDSKGKGIDASSLTDPLGVFIVGNKVTGCTTVGIDLGGLASAGVSRNITILNNTVDGNGGDGLKIAATGDVLSATHVRDNIFSNNGGFNVNFNGASVTEAYLNCYGPVLDTNDTYNGTSGAYNPTLTSPSTNYGDPQLNPTYTNTGGGDYSIGTNLKAKGGPDPLGGTTGTTRNYMDPGAAQRQEVATGGINRALLPSGVSALG
jgi:hypothetical protein